MTVWPTRCADVTYDMADDHVEEPKFDVRPGDLVWQPKGGEGHLITEETEERTYGWTTVEFPLCECGRVDMEDHHVYVLARFGEPS